MEIYLDTDVKRIEYNAAHHILIATWKVAPTSAEFRNGMMAMIKAMEHFKTGRLVYDVTHKGALLEEDQVWAATEWRTQAVAVGHSKVAFVVPEDVFTNMSMEDMMEKADKEVSFAYFGRKEDAIRWVIIPQQKSSMGSDVLESRADQ
ncbi:MAG TPA: hypothetical protein VIM75_20590 [Ohtaekwangia sp.]|uniref:hypothetical protein n=1 Tax=Ohtaekwangia sp. TaxID=2066019 RepID=UPI002F92D3C6